MNNESEIMWELSYINFRYYYNICLNEKNHEKNLSQETECPCGTSKRALHEH
jgi:hypothetical protein